MKVNLKIEPTEWLYIAIFIIVMILLKNNKIDEAIQFLKDCWQLVKK